MKITLEFDSIEEQDDARVALDGYKWKLAMWDLDQTLRRTTKKLLTSSQRVSISTWQTRPLLNLIRMSNLR